MVQPAQDDKAGPAEVQALLKSTAEVYRNLLQHAKAANVPVPREAQLTDGKPQPSGLDYDEFAAAGAADWDDFQDQGQLLCSC